MNNMETLNFILIILVILYLTFEKLRKYFYFEINRGDYWLELWRIDSESIYGRSSTRVLGIWKQSEF